MTDKGTWNTAAGFIGEDMPRKPAGWRDDVLASPCGRRGVTTWSCTPPTPGSSLARLRASLTNCAPPAGSCRARRAKLAGVGTDQARDER